MGSPVTSRSLWSAICSVPFRPLIGGSQRVSRRHEGFVDLEDSQFTSVPGNVARSAASFAICEFGCTALDISSHTEGTEKVMTCSDLGKTVREVMKSRGATLRMTLRALVFTLAAVAIVVVAAR
ncbi:hypothetical protein OG563_42165 [Nocardia vinacea]|uniref:Uncharacterized protein n=1 Tax=Nocardia vinacea TaxID=96468 RepID=A0ABZ1YQV3_9NOCA|nr:hypothetical protein [Nocardia vinacea]